VVVEAELDTGAVARRLRREIAEVYGYPSEVHVLASGGLRKGSHYIVRIVKDGEALKQVPDSKIYVIDLKATPPKLAATITGGKQPSGLSFSPDGKMALVANRGDNSISVLSVNGTDVKITDTISFPDSVAHVMFTPDGKRALAVRFPAHKVSVLDIAGDKVTYNKVDLPTGQWPYNVVVTPNSKIALTSDNGNSGASDGSVDTTSVIDLEANPPRIIDRVVVGQPARVGRPPVAGFARARYGPSSRRCCARSCRSATCCCSTSRSVRSTRSRAPTCRRSCSASCAAPARPRSSSRTTSTRRYCWPTGSS